MPKGTCRAEATPNSRKINPVALAVIELHLSEGISKSVIQWKIPLNFLNFNLYIANYWGRTEDTFGLENQY